MVCAQWWCAPKHRTYIQSACTRWLFLSRSVARVLTTQFLHCSRLVESQSYVVWYWYIYNTSMCIAIDVDIIMPFVVPSWLLSPLPLLYCYMNKNCFSSQFLLPSSPSPLSFATKSCPLLDYSIWESCDIYTQRCDAIQFIHNAYIAMKESTCS